jgi:hypothetical protein
MARDHNIRSPHQRFAAPLIAALALAVLGSGPRFGSAAFQAVPIGPAAGPTTVVIDAAATRQTWHGVGANVRAPVLGGGRDVMPAAARAKAADLLFRAIGIRVGKLDSQLLESPGSYAQRRNDNDNPLALSWSGFQTAALDSVRRTVLDLPEAKPFDGFQIGQMVNTRWASPWLAALRGRDYQRYLDEAAEQTVAACTYWRRVHGRVPDLWQLFNEPLTGNREVAGGSRRDLVDLVTRAGARLAQEGCGNVRFVVASEETEEESYNSAAAILQDPDARRYVGAIGYHVYPYGSVYSRISRILDTTGMGRPDASRVEQRRRLRDLAKRYGVPVWMTEVSHGGVDARSYQAFRGRAIHIHDELEFADAAAFMGMNTLWDMTSHAEHFRTSAGFFDSEGDILLYDNRRDEIVITGLGYAMGHYARWIPSGAIRVEATSGDPLLLVSAFRVDAQQRLVAVLINNASTARRVAMTLQGLTADGPVRGEQSTSHNYWVPLSAPPNAVKSRVEIVLPALSVTTLALNARPPTQRAGGAVNQAQ